MSACDRRINSGILPRVPARQILKVYVGGRLRCFWRELDIPFRKRAKYSPNRCSDAAAGVLSISGHSLHDARYAIECSGTRMLPRDDGAMRRSHYARLPRLLPEYPRFCS